MYAPFGTGVLVGPRRVLAAGDRFLVGGAGFEPGRGETGGTAAFLPEDQGSSNVIGAVALRAAIGAVEDIGWPSLARHDRRIAASLRRGLARSPAFGCSGRVLTPRPCRSLLSPWTVSRTRWSRPGSPPRKQSECGTATSRHALTWPGCSAQAPRKHQTSRAAAFAAQCPGAADDAHSGDLAIQDEPLAVPHAVALIDRHPPAALRLTGAS